MNLQKASPEEKVNICRKYFLTGLAFLPWVWIINIAWFWKEALKNDHIPAIRKYVLFSVIGTFGSCVSGFLDFISDCNYRCKSYILMLENMQRQMFFIFYYYSPIKMVPYSD